MHGRIAIFQALLLLSTLGIGCAADRAPTAKIRDHPRGAGYCSHAEDQPNIDKWVQVDLGQTKVIEQVRLIPVRVFESGNTRNFGFPPRFIVEIATRPDFSGGEIIAELTGGDFEVPHEKPFAIIVNAQKARYIRVTAKKLSKEADGYVFALAELQVFAKGKNVALNANVTALDSTETEEWSQKYLVDGHNNGKKQENTVTRH